MKWGKGRKGGEWCGGERSRVEWMGMEGRGGETSGDE